MKKVSLLALLFTLCLATGASAATYDFTLEIWGASNNTPYIRLINNSTSYEITGFSMTAGHTAWGFDHLGSIAYSSGNSYSVDASVGTLLKTNDNLPSHVVPLNFTGFGYDEFFRMIPDLDRMAGSGGYGYYKTTFFNNGNEPNSLITVVFSDGTTLSGYLPDWGEFSSYSFTSADLLAASPTPIPGAIWLLGTGVLGLFGLRKKIAG